MSDDPKHKNPGPAPDHLKLDEEHWEDAVKKALRKKLPDKDQPKPPKPQE